VLKPVPCPICKQPVVPDARTFPFCSERCRLIDLGNWLDGRYTLTEDGDDEPPKKD
jgi:endogenous inhibitor of DNA gyrase (YacG/DUF329 family)